MKSFAKAMFIVLLGYCTYSFAAPIESSVFSAFSISERSKKDLFLNELLFNNHKLGGTNPDSSHYHHISFNFDTIIDRKWQYIYDEEGNQISAVSFWKYTADWTNSFKYDYVYNEFGKREYAKAYNWSIQEQKWIGYFGYEYEYDDNNNLSSIINIVWSKQAESWITSLKQSYEYDTWGNLIFESKFIKDFEGDDAWLMEYKISYELTLNENNQAMVSTAYKTTDGETWENYQKMKYEYNTEGQLIQETLLKWRSDSVEVWINDMIDEYQYDLSGNIAIQTNFKWDMDTEEWILKKGWEFIYDSNGRIEFVYGFNNNLDIVWFFEYFNNTPVNVDYFADDEIEIYPNPATNQLNITNIEDFNARIFNVNGSLIFVSDNVNSLNIDHLPKGAYLLLLTQDKKTYVRKFIKK